MSNTQTAAPALTIRRTFNASRERVFAAFTDPGVLRQWFGPPGTATSDVVFEARHGGRYRIVMQSSGGDAFIVGGVISEYQPHDLLAYTFRWEEDDPQLEHDTHVRIEFIARGAQTEIVLTQDNFTDAESHGRHSQGWEGAFGKLEAMLAPPIRITGLDFSGYMCKDAKRAMAFYKGLFGLEPSLVYPGDRGCEYDLPDGSTFGLWGGGEHVMPFQPSNGVLFAVADLDAALEKLSARDLKVVFQNDMPSCRLAMIHDSEGNIITLHQRKPH